MKTSLVESPLGPLRISVEQGALVGVYFDVHKPAPKFVTEVTGAVEEDDVLCAAARELAEYFRGARTSFDVPLAPQGTEFQQRVWRALRDIPYGETCSYGELARAVGRETAARAVGAANGRNPLSIVIPCHRVIASDGKEAGYAGGVEKKRWLLSLEKGQPREA